MTFNDEKKLLQKINRKLDGERLKLCRHDSRSFSNLGRCYLVDSSNFLLATDIDLEEFDKLISAT